MRLLLPLLFTLVATTKSLLCQAQTKEDQQDFLQAHNSARSAVGVAPLVWNQTLATFANDFANKVKQTCDNTEQSHGPYGENTASGYGAFTTEDAVAQWVEEKTNYDHHLNCCLNGTECEHYKQVVWQKSLSLGCASILCGAGWPFVVCEYYPPGNAPGQWPY